MLLDVKRRRYLIVLAEGGEFHSHAGFVPHADIVGSPEGVVLRSTRGAEYTVLRPTLEDFVVEMPRGAQVIYPKDLAPICMMADIGPGQRVFESGVGSGALSMTMLRWGADIVGYELREDFANRARANVRSFLGRRRSTATGSSCATATRGSTTVRTTGSSSTCRSRGGSSRMPSASSAPAGSSWPTRRASSRRHRRGGAEGAMDRRPHHRGPPSHLAHRGRCRAPRPSDGRPHRLSHRRQVSRPGLSPPRE